MSMFESMESRRLLSGSFISGNELHVEGTTGADTIEVWVNKAGSRVISRVNGEEASFRLKSIREIEISAFAGDDRVEVFSNVTLPTEIEGGSGRDWLSGGSGADDIDGNAGNDTIFGNAGRDELDGGSGADRISGGAGVDEFDADDAASELVDFATDDRIDD